MCPGFIDLHIHAPQASSDLLIMPDATKSKCPPPTRIQLVMHATPLSPSLLADITWDALWRLTALNAAVSGVRSIPTQAQPRTGP